MISDRVLTELTDRPPTLVVISGPSGVGKDAVLGRMRALGKPYHFAVTATTRPRRPAEVDGVDYIFMTTAEFQKLLEQDGFLEWAQVYGNCYGVPRDQVLQALNKGRDVIVKTDVQGADTLRRLVPQGVFIFLSPPSLRALEERLRARGTEAPRDLERRLRTAVHEMQDLPRFTYVVVNEDRRLDETVRVIDAIITAERCRVGRPRIELQSTGR